MTDEKLDPFNPHVHVSKETAYPHVDYQDALGRYHMPVGEAGILARKRGVDLQPTDSVLPSALRDLTYPKE